MRTKSQRKEIDLSNILKEYYKFIFQYEDLGEINTQKSELIYNNSDHKITAEIVEINGCNIRVTIE